MQVIQIDVLMQHIFSWESAYIDTYCLKQFQTKKKTEIIDARSSSLDS